MTRGAIDLKVVRDRLEIVTTCLADLRALPQASLEEFVSDRRNAPAADSLLDPRVREVIAHAGRARQGVRFEFPRGSVVPLGRPPEARLNRQVLFLRYRRRPSTAATP